MTMTYRSSGTALTNAQIDSNIKTVEHRYSGIPIASAATLTLQDEYNYFVVTGSVAMTGLPDVNPGHRITVEFTGAPLLTHSANFLMPGAVNIQAAAGDVAVFQQEAAGTQIWRCVNYVYKANVLEQYVTQSPADNSTKVATTAYVDALWTAKPGWKLFESVEADGTSGTLEVTGLPTNLKGIKISLSGADPSSASNSTLTLHLGYGGSYGTTSESGTLQEWNGSSYSWPSTGAYIAYLINNGDLISGLIDIRKFGTTRYHIKGMTSIVDGSHADPLQETAGMISTSGHLDRLKVSIGTGNLDGGKMDVWVLI